MGNCGGNAPLSARRDEGMVLYGIMRKVAVGDFTPHVIMLSVGNLQLFPMPSWPYVF